MLKKTLPIVLVLACLTLVVGAANKADMEVSSTAVSGKVVGSEGEAIRGATVTLFDDEQERNISVYSQADGSFEIAGVAPGAYRLRARLLGREDAEAKIDGDAATIELVMQPAGDLDDQRPANDRLGQLHFDNEEDALNFRMMCVYCHQVGTRGFRSPEEPVDWEVMVTRMDGFQGLYEHTQKVLVDKLVSTYGVGAEDTWADYEVPDAPEGEALEAKVTEWTMGKENDAMVHDLEVGKDGKVYIVDMTSDAIEELDPETGKREIHSFPGGKDYYSTDAPVKGPHSIEADADGNMWITLALSGEMAKFDTTSHEFTIVSGHEAPRKRGGYPHTLRVAPNGVVWYTDAALGVFSLDPKTLERKYYKLPSADQVQGGGARGESRGVTPYGIDVAPNGKVWYTKLNGQRVGRIDPSLPDDSPDLIKEWEPPVHGPRRLHVAPDGLVWVPGWASGDIASYNEETDEWKVYSLPHGPNSMPYALNVHPTTGEVWVCGTGTDSMLRFDPKSETFTEYRMPTRVTYTREIEFGPDGSVWTSNSNYPVRHVENGHGAVIRIEEIGG